jgi:hypothetical protein
MSKDVLLQEGDVIYVPPTILAAAALKIGEFIQPLGAALRGAYMLDVVGAGGYSYTGEGYTYGAGRGY